MKLYLCSSNKKGSDFYLILFVYWALTGSNRRPSACKADALPAELSALIYIFFSVDLLALKFNFILAGTSIVFPAIGDLICLFSCFTWEKDPNPLISTVSPLCTDSIIFDNKVLSISSIFFLKYQSLWL